MSETIDWCQKCGARVRAKILQPVQTARATHSSPAESEMWCPECRSEPDERDEAYERAAARARNNDFADTGGKDWT